MRPPRSSVIECCGYCAYEDLCPKACDVTIADRVGCWACQDLIASHPYRPCAGIIHGYTFTTIGGVQNWIR